MKAESKWNNVFLLFLSQALFQTASILVITLSGVAGLQMAPNKNLATLPLAMITVGTAVMMIPASMIIKKAGQAKAFMIGTSVGILSGVVSWYGVVENSFWIFSVGNMLVGAYQGFAQYYRFAAADAVPEAVKSKAISFVVAGGIVAAFAGPNLARFTQNMGSIPFAYSYFSIVFLSIIALGVVSLLKLQPKTEVNQTQPVKPGRSLNEIIRQKETILALISSVTGFTVMVMAMTATPIAMHEAGYSSDDSATVIQWHVIGMFLPSFFTGKLIQKFGVYRIMLGGILILFAHIVLALTGTTFFNFLFGLVIVGLGWNFMFISGSALLTQVYSPEEKEKTQALHDFTVFAIVSVSSFFAGGLLGAWGWQGVNVVLIPLLVLALIAVIRIGFLKKTVIK